MLPNLFDKSNRRYNSNVECVHRGTHNNRYLSRFPVLSEHVMMHVTAVNVIDGQPWRCPLTA